MSAYIATFQDPLSTLVEVDFDEAFVIRMMAENPDQSLFHAVYDCLYADGLPEHSSGASAHQGSKTIKPVMTV
jgi:hypothetical protein